jgi:hypothetical protein
VIPTDECLPNVTFISVVISRMYKRRFCTFYCDTSNTSVGMPSSQEQWVQLNIGGRVIHTQLSTLTSQPSKLRELVGCDFQGIPRDAAGIPHFDRDPATFLHLLNFLRGYRLELSPEDTVLVLEDATYFQMPSLAEHIGGHGKSRGRFLPGPGVSSDGKQFSSLSFVGHCGDFVSRGVHSVLFHLEKVLDGMGIGVVNAAGDTSDREVPGRSGSICYSQTGELMMNWDSRLTVTPGMKWKEGDFVKVEISFSAQGTAAVTFTKGSDVVVHSVEVCAQPLRILVWVQSQGGSMTIAEVSSTMDPPS